MGKYEPKPNQDGKCGSTTRSFAPRRPRTPLDTGHAMLTGGSSPPRRPPRCVTFRVALFVARTTLERADGAVATATGNSVAAAAAATGAPLALLRVPAATRDDWTNFVVAVIAATTGNGCPMQRAVLNSNGAATQAFDQA